MRAPREFPVRSVRTRLLTAAVVLAGVLPLGAAERPRLAVLMVVDGLPAEHLEKLQPWYTAGLKRLLDEGWVEASCNYAHLNTETAPGHASLATGAPPRVHGIVANRWFVMESGKLAQRYSTTQPGAAVPGDPPMFYREARDGARVLVFAEAATHAAWQAGRAPALPIARVGYGERGETVLFDGADAVYLYNFRHGLPEEPFGGADGKGPDNLRVETLGDRLVATFPAARVVSVAGKDRAAIFMAGRARSHAAYWYDTETGRFISSPAYAQRAGLGERAATLVKEFNRAQAGDRLLSRLGALWRPLPAPANAAGLPRAVDPLVAAGYQVPVNGLFFDHDLSRNMNGYFLYPSRFSGDFGDPDLAAKRSGYFVGAYQSPFIDEITADLALALLADDVLALGRDDVPDLLCISFSAHDSVSHNYGIESEENLDAVRRVDLQVGRVLDTLERVVGKGKWALGLSADHGFNEIPELARRLHPGYRGGRIAEGPRVLVGFTDRVNRALGEELCLAAGSEPIAVLEGFSLIYDRERLPLRAVDGPCGAAGRTVGEAEIDAVLPLVVRRLYHEEIAGVLLASQRERWPATDPATAFVVNHYDPERSGDAFLLPRPGVIASDDPGRGSGHGSHQPADTHVPLVFLGAGFEPGRSERASTPYDLAPTLAELLGVTMPDATGASRLRAEAEPKGRSHAPELIMPAAGGGPAPPAGPSGSAGSQAAAATAGRGATRLKVQLPPNAATRPQIGHVRRS
jgi:hypothetical protein